MSDTARNVPPALAAELAKLTPWQERLFWAVVEHPGPIVVQRGRRYGVATVKRLVRDHAAALREPAGAARLSFAEIDELMGEDPDDRAIREAHGFTYDDDYEDRSLLCRNGCRLSYYDIAVGKIRECHATTEGETER